MRKDVFLIGFCLLILGCNSDSKKPVDKDQTNVNDLFEGYFNEYLTFNPNSATYLGIDGYNDKWANNLDDTYLAEKKAFFQKWKDSLQAVSQETINEKDRNEIEILNYLLERNLEGLRHGIQPGTMSLNHPIHQYHRSTHHEFIKLAKGDGAQPFNSKQDYDNFLLKLKDFKLWLISAQSRMKIAIEDKTTLPKKIVVKMIPQFDNWVTTNLDQNPFYFSLSRIPDDVSTEDSLKIVTEYKSFIESDLIPLFQEIKSFLEEEYLEHAREEDGLYAIPRGKEQYAYLVKYWTTTDLTPDEIHQIGLQEVNRIRSEMDSIRVLSRFEGDLQSFFNFVKTDEQFYPFNTIDEVIAKHYQTLETIKPYVDSYFGIKPKAPFEIRPVDLALARAATANYDSPSLDGTRPGIFYDAIPDPKKYSYISMESLFLHEAIPGHHFQIALEQEEQSIPMYRKASDFGAFSEGWGLYCESLGKELGLYTNPYHYLGRLEDEMLRAVRLVVDTGIHAMGWTREQAIIYSMENMPVTEANATVAIERYMVRPGQALSYKIGELKIKELRSKCESQLGGAFSLKTFHDLVLQNGSMPLNSLEKRVDQWLATQKKSLN